MNFTQTNTSILPKSILVAEQEENKKYVDLTRRYISMLDKLEYLLKEFESNPGGKCQEEYMRLQVIKMSILRMDY